MKPFFASLAMALAIPSLAYAQVQTAEQQECINVLNKGLQKLASTQGKAAAKCIAAFHKGKVDSAYACYEDDTKVEAQITKNSAAALEACTSLPNFGPDNVDDVNLNGEVEPKELANDLYEVGPSQDPPACADQACVCQAKTTKSTYKLFDQIIKSFNACKKLGIRDETNPIDSTEDLAACLGADGNRKIENAGIKLDVAVDVSCTGVALPYAAGACSGLTGTSLSGCLNDRARCHACHAVSYADNLTYDCDLFDDEVDNASCAGE